MGLILQIDTATKVCSVSISRDGVEIATRDMCEENAHSTILTVMIDELFKEIGLEIRDLSAVAVSIGPGSYTGLRIGLTVAKGICYGLKIPLIAVPTLLHMAYGALQLTSSHDYDLLCPMIDARRMEVYAAVYDKELNEIEKTSPVILTETSFTPHLNNKKILFFGDGSDKSKSVLLSPNALFIDFLPSAKWMSFLSNSYYNNKTFENIAYATPQYLKEFQTTTPKNKLL